MIHYSKREANNNNLLIRILKYVCLGIGVATLLVLGVEVFLFLLTFSSIAFLLSGIFGCCYGKKTALQSGGLLIGAMLIYGVISGMPVLGILITLASIIVSIELAYRIFYQLYYDHFVK